VSALLAEFDDLVPRAACFGTAGAAPLAGLLDVIFRRRD
jgi:hypothetical protein